jgi:predicted DCC family thiol-disulfide oxidoreductase YuxK
MSQSEPANTCTVYYDGGCPVCAREIGFYQSRSGDAVRFVDVAAATDDPAPDLDRASALARFHVRTADGRLVSGGRAFAELWKTVPALRALGRLASVPPIPTLLDLAYAMFLRIRPLWRPSPAREG